MSTIVDLISKQFNKRNFENSRRWNNAYSPKHIKYTLEQINNPQYQYKTIHIAGTVAKGSTTYLMTQFLMQEGYKVGSYYSPHLFTFHERMQINNCYITDEELETCYLELNSQISHNELSYFDFITLLAFYWFCKKKVDWAIIETGLGGKLDSTNNLNPEIAILTPVDYDHETILGFTLEEIVSEKIAILKGKKNYIYPQSSKVENIIKNKGIQNIKKISQLKFCHIKKPITLYTEMNQQVCSWIFKDYFNIKPKPVDLKFKGRLEVLSQQPFIMFDMGHNNIAIKNLCSWFETKNPTGKWNFYFNTLKERKLSNLIIPFLKYKDRINFYFIKCFSYKFFHTSPQPLEELDVQLTSINQESTFKELLQNNEKQHLIFGSSYLYSFIIQMLDIKK